MARPSHRRAVILFARARSAREENKLRERGGEIKRWGRVTGATRIAKRERKRETDDERERGVVRGGASNDERARAREERKREQEREGERDPARETCACEALR